MAATGHDLRLVKELLWDVVSQYLKPAEKDEVRRAIGWSLSAENEAMFAEATALADILGDVQLSTGTLLERHKLCSNPQRNMVEAEVRMLMDRLREVAGAAPFQGSAVKARDPDAVIPKSNTSEKAVYNYVSAGGSQGLDSRPRTPLTRPTSAASPNRPGTASSNASSRDSVSCDPRSVVQSVHSKLNVFDIDAIRLQLQQALQDEHAALLDDIQYLSALLEGETDLQVKAGQPAPSLQELKEYGHKLKKALEDEEQRVVHEVRVSRMFSAAEEEQSKAGRLRGMVQASRTALPAAPSGNGTAAPSTSVQEVSVLSPIAPRQRSADAHSASARGGMAAEAAGMAPVRVRKTSLSGFSGDTQSSLDRRTHSSGSVLANVPLQAPSDVAEASSSKVHSILAPRTLLGGPSGAKGELSSPVRLKPLPDISSAATPGAVSSSGLRPPPSSRTTAAVGAAAGAVAAASPSLPPKPVQSLGSRTIASSSDSHQRDGRSSSGGTRHSPTSGLSDKLLEASISSPSTGDDDRKSSHRAAATSSGLLSQGKTQATVARSGSARAAHANGSPAAPSNSLNLVDALEAEVDAVIKGGVAAILAKHNYTPRPSSASTLMEQKP